MRCCASLLLPCASSAHEQQSHKAELTDYIATRWYRAPEILLGVGPRGHTHSVDEKCNHPGGIFLLMCCVSWIPVCSAGSHKYTKGVDLWSIGCILGELLSGRPMFPGTSTMNQACPWVSSVLVRMVRLQSHALFQLERIMAVTGMPTAEDIGAVQSIYAEAMIGGIAPPEHKWPAVPSLLSHAPIFMMNVCMVVL